MDDALNELADLATKRTETDPGALNSNEILDKGASGVLVGLKAFCPLYNDALQFGSTELGPLSYERDILQRYDEQRDIPFHVFRQRAEEIEAVREQFGDALSHQSNRMATVFSHWQSGAGDSARGMWQQIEKISRHDVEDGLAESAEAILRSCSVIAAACHHKADWSLRYAFDTWGPVPAADVERAIDVARQGRAAADSEITYFAKYLGDEATAAIAGDKGGLEAETKDAAQAWAKEWLARFAEEFASFVGHFHTMCDNTRSQTDEAWGQLAEFLLGLPEDPYAGVAAGGMSPRPAVSMPSPGTGPGPEVGGASPVTGTPFHIDPSGAPDVDRLGAEDSGSVVPASAFTAEPSDGIGGSLTAEFGGDMHGAAGVAGGMVASPLGEDSDGEAAPAGGAGVGSIPGGDVRSGVAGVAGAASQQRASSYPLGEIGLFEPEAGDGAFGISRISGSLDDDEPEDNDD